MASTYRRSRSYPIPDGAEIVERKRKATSAELKKHPEQKHVVERFAKWTDGKGRKRRERLNDTGDKIIVQSGSYLIDYWDENGKKQTVNSGTSDRDAAQQLAGHLETEAMKRRTGQIDPTLERFAKQAQRPIAEHIADFRASLEAKENTSKHVELTEQRVRFIVNECGATHIKHLTPSAVQQAIKGIRDAGRSLETCNSYLRAIKSFSRWLWRDKRTADHALATLERYNAETDPRHLRRELTPEELAYLLPFVEGYTKAGHNLAGPDRAMAYRVALGTGFRADELRSLTPASFDLDSDPPTVTVGAAYSKRRRNDVQPIRRDLADLLRPWLAEQAQGGTMFSRMPSYAARMLRKDLAAARQQWIGEPDTDAEQEARKRSDFLRYEDSAGRFADFHSTRHTYISGIVASGASVKTSQELARHSDPRLTIGRYSHVRLMDLQGALEALPDTTPPKPEQQPQQATGTEGLSPVNRQQMPVNRQQLCGEKGVGTGERRRKGDRKEADEAGATDTPQTVSMTPVGKKKATSGETWREAEGTGLSKGCFRSPCDDATCHVKSFSDSDLARIHPPPPALTCSQEVSP